MVGATHRVPLSQEGFTQEGVKSSLTQSQGFAGGGGLDICQPGAGFGAILGCADGEPWSIVLLAPGAGMLAKLDPATAERLGRELVHMAELARRPGAVPE
jgi:hypothetical protein|tara:strand:- start:35591 stop:35890 length:300 start_codon:yes stop_codon:yes gene_type:complete